MKPQNTAEKYLLKMSESLVFNARLIGTTSLNKIKNMLEDLLIFTNQELERRKGKNV